jgi:stage IV sporulation protein FB
MLLFQPPQPTRFDLRFTLFGIPVRVHPLFWLMAVLFGISGNDILSLLVWVPVVFLSILIHELGHALAMRRYGQPSYIVLHAAGGLTVPEPVGWGRSWASIALRPGQEILVSFAGPLAGFLLAGLVLAGVLAGGGSILMTRLFGLIPFPAVLLPTGSRLLNTIVLDLVWVNFFWGLINLLPVLPLDGGSIARHLFVQADPLNGTRKSLWLSVIAGGVVALAGLLLMRSIYVALLFGYLAFQSYLTIRGRTWGGY